MAADDQTPKIPPAPVGHPTAPGPPTAPPPPDSRVDPADIIPPLAPPVFHPLLNQARARTRSVRFRIDNFEGCGGPLRIVADQKLSPSERVYDEWMYSETFTIGFSGKQKLPLIIRAYRYPIDLAPTEAKETMAALDPEQPNTWTEDALRRGDAICARDGWCRHTPTGFTCPMPYELHGGEIRHGDGVWVLRRDGVPVPESQLEEFRAREAQERGDQDRIVEARKLALMSVPVMSPVHIPTPMAPHPNAAAGVIPPGGHPVAPPAQIQIPTGIFDEKARMSQEIPSGK